MIIMLRSEINAAGKNKGEYKTKIIKIKKPIYHSCERNEIRLFLDGVEHGIGLACPPFLMCKDSIRFISDVCNGQK